MRKIRETYADALEFDQHLLAEIIDLLVIEKKALSMDDDESRLFDHFLNPPPGKYEAWNEHYKRELAKMRNKSA